MQMQKISLMLDLDAIVDSVITLNIKYTCIVLDIKLDKIKVITKMKIT